MRVAALVATLVGLPASVHAVEATNGIWGNGGSYASCQTGIASRVCSFTFHAYDCTEAGVSGVRLLGCDAWVVFDVAVRPIVHAGRVAGCESGDVRPRSGAVGFNGIVPTFDNSEIDEIFLVSVKDLFADGKPGTVTFSAVERGVKASRSGWRGDGLPAPALRAVPGAAAAPAR